MTVESIQKFKFSFHKKTHEFLQNKHPTTAFPLRSQCNPEAEDYLQKANDKVIINCVATCQDGVQEEVLLVSHS